MSTKNLRSDPPGWVAGWLPACDALCRQPWLRNHGRPTSPSLDSLSLAYFGPDDPGSTSASCRRVTAASVAITSQSLTYSGVSRPTSLGAEGMNVFVPTNQTKKNC